MGVLNDGNSTQAQPGAAKKATGYARPLFTGSKPKFNDDRMIGGSAEKKELNIPDENKAKKILDGLCQDIFFRAEDLERVKDLPDCTAPVQVPPRPITRDEKITGKPLNSKNKDRTYSLSTKIDKPEERRRRPERRHRDKNRHRRRRR